MQQHSISLSIRDDTIMMGDFPIRFGEAYTEIINAVQDSIHWLKTPSEDGNGYITIMNVEFCTLHGTGRMLFCGNRLTRIDTGIDWQKYHHLDHLNIQDAVKYIAEACNQELANHFGSPCMSRHNGLHFRTDDLSIISECGIGQDHYKISISPVNDNIPSLS